MASYEQCVRGLLAADAAEVRQWECTAFDRLSEGRRLVLCGAGGLGRKTLRGLRAAGVEPIAFADNNRGLWGKDVDGLRVLDPAEAAARFGDAAAFVVTSWGAHSADRLADRLARLRSLGCGCVLSFRTLFWKYPSQFLPHYACDLPHRVHERADQVAAAAQLWCDEASRIEYLEQIRWRTTIDHDGLPQAVGGPAYFPPDLIRMTQHERFVDCGAFDGDTFRDFVRVTDGRFSRVWALEPDPANYATLCETVAACPEDARRRVDVIPLAVAETAKMLRFAGVGLASSGFSEQGEISVQCVAIDELLGGDEPTFIKMDIEGAEPDALRGASRVVRGSRPILAISAYHLQEHIWQIPLQLAEMVDDYHFHLRPHDNEGWDLVCYAIPVERAITSRT